VTSGIVNFATQYGYLAVFIGVIIETFGVPFPGETTILVGAVLAGAHKLNPLGVGIAAWLAAVVGPTLSYLVFRRWGRRVIALSFMQRLYKPSHVERAETFFAKHGWWGVFATRYVVFLRIFTGPLAGLHRMPMPSFMLANALGAAGWVTIVVAIGLLIGNHLDRGLKLISTLGFVGLAFAILLFVAFLAWYFWRQRNHQR
jgi:membrane protein DedA with SNARE-associated domain